MNRLHKLCDRYRRLPSKIHYIAAPRHPHSLTFCTVDNMRSQYPDHGHFDSQRAGGMITDAMQFMSNTVSLETLSCIVYVVALVYTAGQCMALLRWVIGMPVAISVASPRAGKKHV